MKFLKKPVVAIILCVATVILSSAISIDVKLSNRAGKVINSFYDAASTRPIGFMLTDLCLLTDDLAPLADNYGLENDLLLQQRNELEKLVDRRENDISEVYKAYDSVSATMKNVLYSLENMSLSERHTQMVEQYSAAFSDIQNEINASTYNENVRKFLKSYDRFPARNFSELFSVEYPAYFR